MAEDKPAQPVPPSLRAPLPPLALGTLIAAVAAAAVAYAAILALDPSAAWTAVLSLPVVLLAAGGSLLFVAAQGRQTLVTWPGKWLAGSGIRAAATLLLAALAFIFFKPPLLPYALSLLGGYIAVLIVETAIFTMALNRTWKAETPSAATTETEKAP